MSDDNEIHAVLRGPLDHDGEASTGQRRKVERVLERRLRISGAIVTD